MNYPEGVLAVGAILLTLIGGIAGNIFTVLVMRIRGHRNENLSFYDYLLLVIIVVLLVIVTAPFVNILFTTNFVTNPTVFLLCIGILFGIIGSILSNFFSAAFDRHIDSKIKDGRWLNNDGKLLLGIGVVLSAYIIYLLWLFSIFN
ncbi:MAG: hypothetical protein ABFD50_06450 [Smithella sp.]